MMWLFAVLIVLAMGGVALVAAGRGEPLAEEFDDRPDAEVPATGRLTGEDLRRVRFSLAFRGYRMSEVDALLDRLASERDVVRREGAVVSDPDVTGGAPRVGPGVGPGVGSGDGSGDGPGHPSGASPRGDGHTG